MSKLSIIVTTYNIENYIEKCLNSIVNQTLSDIEIIIVDDASTDGTQDIISQFSQSDDRIKTVFFKTNTIGGVSSAANAGLDIASGEYIGFADGDDWYELDMFERLYNLATSQEADIVFCNYKEFDERNDRICAPSDATKWDEIKNNNAKLVQEDVVIKNILRLNPVPWRKIYRRDLLEQYNIRFPVGDYFFEDNPFHWETTARASGICFDDFIGCYHRINRPGQTMGTADARLLAMYEHHATILKFLNESNQLERFREQLLAWLIGNSCWISKKIDEQFLHQLFTIIGNELEKYDRELVDSLVKAKHWGVFGGGIVDSCLADDFELFKKITRISDKKIIRSNAKSNSLVKQAYLTYKHQGISELVRKIKLYLEIKYSLKVKKPKVISKNDLYTQNKKIISQNEKILKELELLKLCKLIETEQKREKL